MASIERIPPCRGRRRAQKGKSREGQTAQGVAAIARSGRRGAVRLALAAMLWGGCTIDAGAQERSRIPQDEQDQRSFAAFLAMVQDEVQPPPADAVDSNTSDGIEAAQPLDAANTLPQPVQAAPVAEEPLKLADVVASLYRAYPDIQRARQLRPLAGGELLSAYGAYDTKFHAHSLSEPTGFYENYRSGLGLARQTWWGGYLSAGYRIGRGFYQPWYKERQTDDAGELKISAAQPLLQGRAIDPQRVAVFQASLQQQAAEPQFQQAILSISSDAIGVYWEWVAAGAVLKAQQELLDLAVKRGKQFEVGVEAGKFATVNLVLNQQLIAERSALRLKAQQKFQATAFKLSLYLRNESGQPLVPAESWLPTRFPVIEQQTEFDFNADLAAALGRRPEPQILQYEMRQVQWDRRLAHNELLPRFDFVTEASQDMGEPATKSDDKGDFELMIGFQSEVPIQRRKARGKIQSTSAKIIQINEKLRLVRDKIATDLQISQNQLMLAQQIVEQSELSLRAALDTLARYQKGFEKGYIDLIYLNLLETKANETEIKLVEAQRDWFTALGALQIALGLDPLDQAVVVSSLPASEMPGPGNLPEVEEVDDQEIERAFQPPAAD
ncbi:TolC family protein [Stieleria sedimenti]|uniref:TolC family protein n=1 Tax=Stieleria sedimenti TaxID=2976331 RepID=UPI002180585B|nr:TolC family protein [Stieleria sedimenti]